MHAEAKLTGKESEFIEGVEGKFRRNAGGVVGGHTAAVASEPSVGHAELL
jgi:hypothetical protein